MSERFVVARFRERRRERPLRESRRPEMDPGEVAATCDVCGSWGIVDLDDVKACDPIVAFGLRPGLACHECREAAHELAEDVDDRTVATDGGVEAARVCSACGEPTGYVVDEDGSVGGTALSECCRAGLRVEVSSS